MTRRCLCKADRSDPTRGTRQGPSMSCCRSRGFVQAGSNTVHQLAMVRTYVHSPRRDTMLSSKPSLRPLHLRSHVFHRIAEISRCILAFCLARRWGTEICCRDTRWPCNSPHHSRRRSRGIHRNGSSRVCRVHWHNEIGHRDMAENLCETKKSH